MILVDKGTVCVIKQPWWIQDKSNSTYPLVPTVWLRILLGLQWERMDDRQFREARNGWCIIVDIKDNNRTMPAFKEKTQLEKIHLPIRFWDREKFPQDVFQSISLSTSVPVKARGNLKKLYLKKQFANVKVQLSLKKLPKTAVDQFVALGPRYYRSIFCRLSF